MSKFPQTSRDDILPGPNPTNPGKKNKDWGLQSGEGNENLPGNPLNNPVPVRKGKEPVNGWQEEAFDTNQDKEI